MRPAYTSHPSRRPSSRMGRVLSRPAAMCTCVDPASNGGVPAMRVPRWGPAAEVARPRLSQPEAVPWTASKHFVLQALLRRWSSSAGLLLQVVEPPRPLAGGPGRHHPPAPLHQTDAGLLGSRDHARNRRDDVLHDRRGVGLMLQLAREVRQTLRQILTDRVTRRVRRRLPPTFGGRGRMRTEVSHARTLA
jgi:hypothetical protein